MWIGSEKNKQLLIDQQQSFQHYISSTDDDADDIGWGATDGVYPCSDDALSRVCQGGKRKSTLPRSAMSTMPKGWRCAQTRPLRALAHVLTLVDPQFVVVVDDDTYVNMQLLYQSYNSFIFNTSSSSSSSSSSHRYALGEFMGRIGEFGHVSKIGIMGGGSGYILTRNTVLALTSYEVAYWGFENPLLKELNKQYFTADEYRSVHHIHQLSLLKELMDSCSIDVTNPREQSMCLSKHPHKRSYSQIPNLINLNASAFIQTSANLSEER
jgi:hypothetical protein